MLPMLRLVYIRVRKHKKYVTVYFRILDFHTHSHTMLHFLLRTRMTLIATFLHTLRLSSKGTAGSGNASQIRVYCPKLYRTLLYCTVPLCGNEAFTTEYIRLRQITHDELVHTILAEPHLFIT